ncbi:cation:proton antiporter [Rhodobacteraceae bacterium N5(2021)]|uniref:Cation:proton antiporter n=2 Tax=Gymnodinialimonas phycosphaerae TaxID=2841589 RepID=A0A975YI34_9RHOB|nr:cation:proton antiporter [Gymnodinialimonas phycosphaerae]
MDHAPSSLESVILGVLLCAMAYSLLSKAISRTILTLPLLFVAIGYLFAPATQVFGTPVELRGSVRLLAEVTLVLVLFADASHVRFAQLKTSFTIPLRMLILGMPATIALGTLVVFVIFPEGGLALAFLTAALLTPTDAALGQSVVSSPDVPEILSQSINVESGLNDGLALPFVLLGAVLASSAMQSTDGLALQAATQLVLGPLVGIAVGWGAARALDVAQRRDWIVESAEGIVFLCTALICFLAAELINGNGFIAAFVAGAVFGNTYRHDIHFISEFMEGAGQLLTMAAFLMFGALMLPDGLSHFTWSTCLIALSFLTLVRVLPIFLSLTGTGLAVREKLFLGWFGPRGLASILFTLIMMDEFELPAEGELLACVSLTVALSVLLHGISATPLAKRIARRTKP